MWWGLWQGGVQRDAAFDATFQRKPGIVEQKGEVMAVDYGQEKIVAAPEIAFHSADDHRTVGIPDFLDDQANCVSAFLAERPGKEIRTVVQLPRGGLDPQLCTFWNRARGRSIVQDGRYRTRRQSHSIIHCLQRDRSRLASAGLPSCSPLSR